MQQEVSPYGRKLRSQFALADDFAAMNHGSYGTAPKSVLEARRQVLERCENDEFFIKWDYYPELTHSRELVARQINCPSQDLVLILNSTTGTNTILWSIDFKPGDKILYYATTYSSLMKTITHVCHRTGAQAVKIDLECIRAGCMPYQRVTSTQPKRCQREWRLRRHRRECDLFTGIPVCGNHG